MDSEFTRYVQWRALSRTVLCVATTRAEGAWAAYCDSVPGKNHDNEAAEVLRVGCKLRKDVAAAIFHGEPWSKLPYAP